MVAWFDHDKETDWATFGGTLGDSTYTYNSLTYKTYTAYKTAVGSSNFISPNVTTPRLLTDRQFAGQ